MSDYKDLIQVKHDQLLEEFEEEHGYAASEIESQKLYEQAMDDVNDAMSGHADDLRKREKGE